MRFVNALDTLHMIICGNEVWHRVHISTNQFVGTLIAPQCFYPRAACHCDLFDCDFNTFY